ncbi:MAG: hypothetical protein CME97_01530 [Hyphomonas sp.]|uniref:hypothetical protein n=1 Tax=Hyphomonas sp. UBA3601 TaxID=1946626 RepID=UPI000C61EB96|nr:hypothetical protein [Hyphomonas sp. UBA3601]MAA80974.1 hypothetical protein [Hyphomonas sp.]MAN90157.1 hypothetical protein [Hyphomonadaceae bacterium]HBL95348.1 hypothetical protein [Hyphomonas sp.]HCN93072.1 hypothetical protein [Hyphomonas sp.]|tara:strand:- start:112844 stop:113101 length:258 start_codon:yes stop_codon:yes gene_type:complete
MDNRAFERVNKMALSRAVGRMKGTLEMLEDKGDFADKDDDQNCRQGEHGQTEQSEGRGKGLQFSHSANLSCELANADVAEGLGVA